MPAASARSAWKAGAAAVRSPLEDGTLRFSELRRRVEGITQKMLTQPLRALERDGLVDREVIPTVPVTVRHTLTPLGHSLARTVDVIRTWAYTNMDATEAARETYLPTVGPPTPTAASVGVSGAV